MKRFLLFAGDEYEPMGGWGDFVNDFSLLEDAISQSKIELKKIFNDWVHVVDTQTKEVVYNDSK